MKNIENLQKIFTSYKADVDALGESYSKASASDVAFNDQIRQQRAAERNATYNGKIDALAEKAKAAAMGEIETLQDVLNGYITGGDVEKLQTLQALIASGVKLSSGEIKVFADGASYAILRVLEPISNGAVKAPNIEQYVEDVKTLKLHADALKFYRGSLASVSDNTGLFGGVTGKTGLGAVQSNVIVSNWLTSPGLDEMRGRWAKLEVTE